MKIFKLKKSHYGSLEKLLSDVGAISSKANTAYPTHVYASKEDLKKMTRQITLAFRKEYPNLTDRALKSAVGMYMLNLAPSSIMAKAIRPGYILVNQDMVEHDKNLDEQYAKEEAIG